MQIHTSGELREIDRRAADELGVPTALLMENAGRAVADAVREAALARGGRVVVVCGKGNNGGDGYVAARHLLAAGFRVSVVPLASLDQLAGEALLAARAAAACGVADAPGLAAFGRGDVVVDAVLGTGLSRPVHGRALELVREIASARARGAFVVAVDLPSGLDADLPEPPGEAVHADVTVSLHALKTALVQYPARGLCGEVRVASIGIPPGGVPGPRRLWADLSHVRGLLPPRPADAHKGTNGHLLVVAGSSGKSGAAMLTSRAAMRTGAGLVTLAAPPEVIDRVLPSMAEVMGHALSELNADGLRAALVGKRALAIGPGIEWGANTAEAIVEVLCDVEIPALLDADALNALAASPRARAGIREALVAPLLTPHPAEMARLLGTTTAQVQQDRFAAAVRAAETFQAHVVLKGACTVVAHPDGSLEVMPFANPALATGGTGDVLTGIGGALLAQGLSARDAGVLAAYLHGLAGELAACGLARGLVAGDLVDHLPRALGELSCPPS